MDDIERKILDILVFRFKVTPSLLTSENLYKFLTGSPFFFSPYDVAYLCLEIEKEFKITFLVEELFNYRFANIQSIKELVFEKCV